MSTNGKFSFLHSRSFTSGDWAAQDLSVLLKTESKTLWMPPPFLHPYYSDDHLHRNLFNVFLSLLTYFKRLKLSAVVEQGWCCEDILDNLNRNGASWTKGPKIIYGACVNLEGLWISWNFPWHVLERCNTLRKSTWIYECRLHNLPFFGVRSTEIVHVKWILCVQLCIWCHWL